MSVPLHQVETWQTSKGLYESYYFRGTNDNSAFWLKHNLLRETGSTSVRVENTVVLTDLSSGKISVFGCKEELSSGSSRLNQLRSHQDWRSFSFRFFNGSFFRIEEDRLSGEIIDGSKKTSWDLKVNRSGQSLYHFFEPVFYRIGFPKKKILTADTRVKFSGGFCAEGDGPTSSEWLGMNGHNWGKEHAYRYAYANCNQWMDGPEEAYFDGFSAQIKLMGRTSPYLSSGALWHDGKWYLFNRVLRSFKHLVKEVSAETWKVRFVSEDHTMDIEIEGGGNPWATLDYAHPNGRVSAVRNTKFANGKISLRTQAGDLIVELESSRFELENLIP